MARKKKQIGHGGGQRRQFGGESFSRKVGTKTKANAKKSAAVARNKGKRARVVKLSKGWAVYTRG